MTNAFDNTNNADRVRGPITPNKARTLRAELRAAEREYGAARAALIEAKWAAGVRCSDDARGVHFATVDSAADRAYAARADWMLTFNRVNALLARGVETGAAWCADALDRVRRGNR